MTAAELKARYLDAPELCPYCQSPNVEGTGDHTWEGDQVWNYVTCTACKRNWTDGYRLADVVLELTDAEKQESKP